MKNLSSNTLVKILIALIAVLFIWAAAATVMILQKPVVVISSQPEAPDSQKVVFLNTFIQNYFNYSASTIGSHYHRNQAFLGSSLKENLLEEISKKQTQLEDLQIQQKAKVLALRALSNGNYESEIELTSQHKNKSESLLLNVTLVISSTPPSSENVTGLLVEQISITPLQERPLIANLSARRLLTLEVPCPFKSSNLQDAVIVQKTHSTQIEWPVSAQIPDKIEIQCAQTSFQIETHQSNTEMTLFLSLLPQQGEKIKRSRDQYEKTIEKVLGISLE